MRLYGGHRQKADTQKALQSAEAQLAGVVERESHLEQKRQALHDQIDQHRLEVEARQTRFDQVRKGQVPDLK